MAFATINKPNQHFNTVTWTGNGTLARAITGVGFQPDFTWIKNRSAAEEHLWYDAVRGVSKLLRSNNTAAEATTSTTVYFNSFDSDGFTIGTETAMNASGQNIVGWNWKASNATAVSNTAGTISSTVSANTTSGFSIVSYTGTGANATVGHGLGVAPKMIIVKKRSGTSNWNVYHKNLTSANYYLILNDTTGQITTNDPWNNTAPTSTVFSIKGTAGDVNDSGATYIAYCFADVKGYSKFGSYTGNGSTDGPFIYTGFKPAFLIAKRTDSTSQWVLYDNKRQNNYNPQDERAYPNLSDAPGTGRNIDFLSNGIKLRSDATDSSAYNISGATYIYMAFAEQPLVGTNNVPATAR
jgi:hypothetical protein